MATTTESTGPQTLGKVRPHQTQNEALLFEKSSPGKRAYKLPPLDVPAVYAAMLLGVAHRTTPGELPELSEIEIIRHFTRLSTWNYAIDLGMYPLGSCTMKYNPRVNEFVARVEGLANGHPYQALHPALDVELRHRSRHVSPGLLHHEVQPTGERVCRARRGPRQRPSLSGTSPGSRRGITPSISACIPWALAP